jgi:two-component sensor histidine kinase
LISSIINLQIKDTDNAEAKDLLQESRQKIHSMALVHDFIYNAGTSDRINLSEYLKVLSKEIFRSAVKHYSLRKLNLDIAPDIIASLKISIPCGLIVNELITNSLKHAFTKDNQGTIDVSLHMQQDNLNLIISDDGKGMGQAQFDKTGQCLGLNLVKLLVENQLKGKINFNGSNGTKFEIIIPNK